MLQIPFTDESRIQLIKLAIEKTNAKKYLEIGCDRDKIFNAVMCDYKIGVDPAKGGTHRMTSDEFFLNNKEKFDVIFIDGLHIYDQVSRDFFNSLDALNDNGIIILHDMLPRVLSEAVVPIPKGKIKNWLGDVWRLGFDLSMRSDIVFQIVLIDSGCGIAWRGTTTSKKFIPTDTWEYYEKNWDQLPLISFEKIKNQLK